MVEVKAKSSLDPKGFDSGVDKMGKKVGKFEKQLGGLKGKIGAAFSIGAIAITTRQSIAFASELTDLSTALNLTTDEFQGLEVAALKAGLAKEKVRGIVTKLGIALGQAKEGVGTYVDAFVNMGISADRFNQMSVPETLEAIAETVVNAGEGSVELSSAWEILGARSGPALKEVLLEISNVGFVGLIDKAKEAGDVIDGSLLKRMDELEDRLQIGQRRIKVYALEGIGFLQDRITELAAFYGGLTQGVDAGIEAFDAERAGRNIDPGDALKKRRAAQAESGRIAAKGRADAAATAVIDKLRLELGKQGRALLQDSLSIQDRLAAREAELAATKKELAGISKDSTADRLKKMIEVSKLEREVLKLRKDQAKEQDSEAKKVLADEKKGKAAAEKLKKAGEGITVSTIGDRLARIGGQIGTQASPQARVAQAQLQIAKKQLEIVKELPAEIAKKLAPELGLA